MTAGCGAGGGEEAVAEPPLDDLVVRATAEKRRQSRRTPKVLGGASQCHVLLFRGYFVFAGPEWAGIDFALYCDDELR
jgi:hypothetical protein